MRVLVTRPESQGTELCTLIENVGGYALHYPLIDIQFSALDSSHLTQLRQADIVIAVSQYAVYGLSLHFSTHPDGTPNHAIYLGVGQKTAHELSKLVQQNVHYPSVSDSEHLLALPELEDVVGKRIVILRGNGGRELIFDELTKRGAHVHYLQLYQRQYRPVEPAAIHQWQQAKIDTMVVTSAEQLAHLVSVMPEAQHTWLKQQRLLVPSERIAKQAIAQGFNNVTNSQGASNPTLFAALQRLKTGLNNDEQK
ncbi:uroporphyrinogen-III synthase [Vibrio sp. 10N]|uniref:uroporphyrinogen-III synthase n=1 Tax=Vibrio sp. 10N TaxID=3058938 RepID=UPI0028139ED2|nr:uroporphyrinogen-III synthase [Vibrio sp. 10N]